ncbi:hypothetical protein OHA21_20140 [Actinoplanes sp. NBC_00393]|uniref:hypothetical protein n=1 Tax=Actinoplanes sp. NBC_00393 TaxID=2975953 RepID=UPI002E1B6FC7
MSSPARRAPAVLLMLLLLCAGLLSSPAPAADRYAAQQLEVHDHHDGDEWAPGKRLRPVVLVKVAGSPPATHGTLPKATARPAVRTVAAGDLSQPGVLRV